MDNIIFSRIKESGAFDEEWYKENYPDVVNSGLHPIEHYLQIGCHLKRNPNRDFDTSWYLEANRDVRVSGANPFYHYLFHGKSEGRSSRPIPRESSKLSGDNFWRIPGQRERIPGHRTILLCAHTAFQQLFGGERSLLDMLDGLKDLNFNVVVTVPKVINADYIAALKKRSIAIYNLPIGWWKASVPLDPVVIEKLCSIISGENIDVVHSNTIMLREPVVAARRMGIRSLVHARELILHDEALLGQINLPAHEIIQWLWDNADHIIANSEATASGFEKSDRRPSVVYNTVDMLALRDLPPPGNTGPLRVGLISSNRPKKGLDGFTEIAVELWNRPDIHFNIIGPETSFTQEIQQKIDRGVLPSSIKILGYRENPVDAIAEVDIVLSISTFQESFGRTVLEGMAAGRPVIVHDHGAPPELITDRQSGFLVPYNDMKAVAARLTLLADNRDLLNRMSKAAKDEAFERFGKERYADSLGRVYDDLFTNHTPGKRLVLPARTDIAPLNRTDARIAYFMWHFPVPSETFVLNELRILRSQGVDVLVFCRFSPHKDFKPDFDISWEEITSPSHLALRLKDTDRTIVHSHFVFPTVTEMVWPACEEAGIPFTFIAHAQDIFRYRNDTVNRIGEIVRSPLCRRIFVPSRFHQDYLMVRGVPFEKMVPSANGCDDSLYAEGRVEERGRRSFRHVVAIHRFAEKKGLENLIHAANLLSSDDIKFSIYGYGDLENVYRKLISDLGISNVKLFGPVKGRLEMLEIFRNCDLFACPSIRASDGDIDGIPTVLMEAMSAGLPVITSAISGIPDLVEDGITGFVADSSPDKIASRIREYYALPDEAVNAVIENGLERIRQDYNSERLVEVMLRVWCNETIDLMIVSWNNLPELYEVTQRLIRNTSLPYHLIICDNDSRPATLAYLVGLQAAHDNITLVINRQNSYVGPGTNICLAHGKSDLAFYVCGKEGMTVRRGWEIPLVHYMNANPYVGQAGTLCYSPAYLVGGDYPSGVALFSKFRNQDFAHKNPDREFSHVQGGFFVMRRQMFNEIGGFSDDVPHAYTDVEFSYFVESNGWRIGQAPGLLSLYNKTRPGLFNRIDERMGALHPPTLADMPVLDALSQGRLAHCNSCGRHYPIPHEVEVLCPHCGSTPRSRTLQRYLSESVLLYRRLTALAISAPESLLKFWRHQFDGHALPADAMLKRLNAGQSLGIEPETLPLILLNDIWREDLPIMSGEILFAWASGLLADNGVLLISGHVDIGKLSVIATQVGLELKERKRFVSAASHYDWLPLFVFGKVERAE